MGVVCVSAGGCSLLRSALGDSAAETRRLVDQAREAEQQGHLDRAERLLNRALRKDPENVEARRQLADVLIAKGNVPAAVDHLQSAVTQNPQDIDGLMRLAHLFFQEHQHHDADALLNAVLRVDPGHVEALQLKASIAKRQGRDEQALAMYYRILHSEPENSEARLEIAAIYLKQSQPDRAAPLLRAVCRNSQANPRQQADAWWSLGIAYGQQNRWIDADHALTQALTPSPSPTGRGGRGQRTRRISPDEWYRLAYARYRAGDLAGSRQALTRVLDGHPKHEAAQILASRLDQDTRSEPTIAEGHSAPLATAGSPNGVISAGHTAAEVPAPAGWSNAR